MSEDLKSQSADAEPCVCVLQVNALACSGGVDNLVLLDRERFRPLTQGVASAGLVIDNEVKWRVGEAEFESLMRMLDNLVGDL